MPLKKIKPNAPCPCGSGKKYKKCCKGQKPQVIQETSYIASKELFKDFLNDLHSNPERLSFLFTIMSYEQQGQTIRHINKLINADERPDEKLLIIRERLLKIQNNSLGLITWGNELDAEHTKEEFGRIINELTGNLVRDIKQMTISESIVPQIIKKLELIGVYLKLSEFKEADSVCKLVIKQVQGKTNLKDVYYIAMMFSAHSKKLFAQNSEDGGDMEKLYEDVEKMFEFVLPEIKKKNGKTTFMD